MAEAKSAVKLAIELSPFNSRYLSELGEMYQLEKNWPKAKETFEAAEENAGLSPAELKGDELGRARRGLGYVFVELGKLEEAEKKYQQCLAADPHDTRAARELEYVRGLQTKTKSH
jgi:tetratricopeptide (TPR) repeat protein